MKNILELELQITQTKITIAYGEKAYKKIMNKFEKYPQIDKSAVTSIITKNNQFNSIVIGCKKSDSIYSLKALVVHELSHAVTELMDYYGFKCDEFRSYTLQYLYQETMPWLDEILLKKAISKEEAKL